MKLFVFLAALICTGSLPAQTPETNAAPETPLTPAQVADYQKRFEEGYALEKAGSMAAARMIYEGILTEQPEAKRSLLEAGRISLELNEPLKAEAYLERLHTLVPDFPEAIELLIQSSEALKHDVKAERLVREYRALRDSGRVPHFSDSLLFEREHIRLDADEEIVISQFFDYTKPPYYTLKAELLDASRQRRRLLLLKYDPDGTKIVRAKDPKLAQDEVFILAEPFFTGDRMTRIDVYRTLLSTPDYNKARGMMLLALTQTPKPIYSEPVTANPGTP